MLKHHICKRTLSPNHLSLLYPLCSTIIPMFSVLQLLCMIRTPDRYKTKIADLQGMIEKDLMEMEQVLVSLSQWNKIELVKLIQNKCLLNSAIWRGLIFICKAKVLHH